jgi:ATPase subunit of ABC transporter with duplicated ATPase domains
MVSSRAISAAGPSVIPALAIHCAGPEFADPKAPYTMLSLEHINLRRGPELLLEDASFVLHKGTRVGVVGRNGSGKSSLFKLIMGELESDGGTVQRPADWRFSMMVQEVPALAQPALDYVLDGNRALRHWEAALAKAQDSDDNTGIARAHAMGQRRIELFRRPRQTGLGEVQCTRWKSVMRSARSIARQRLSQCRAVTQMR